MPLHDATVSLSQSLDEYGQRAGMQQIRGEARLCSNRSGAYDNFQRSPLIGGLDADGRKAVTGQASVEAPPFWSHFFEYRTRYVNQNANDSRNCQTSKLSEEAESSPA